MCRKKSYEYQSTKHQKERPIIINEMDFHGLDHDYLPYQLNLIISPLKTFFN